MNPPSRCATPAIRNALLGVLFGFVALCIAPAHAHKPSDSYLSMSVFDNRVEGQWDIALRDLEFAIGIDSDGDGQLTWDEVRSRHAAISAYALSRLALSNAGNVCAIAGGEQLIDRHSDGAYAVLRFQADCAEPIEALQVKYRLLFDVDAQHKGLFKLQTGGASSVASSGASSAASTSATSNSATSNAATSSPATTATAIFSAERPVQQFDVGAPSRLRQFTDYLLHGVWHIWIGFDHVLFLLSLLLPAVLVLNGKKWQAAPSFHAALVDVLKIVTAFTLAHSITLALAAFEIVSLPSRWVETAIAASVVVAALNNVIPFFQGQRWLAAFVFGLIHGFGFASVLGDLGLPQSALLLTLIGFNIGVELGQLAIVAAFLPLAYAARQTWTYRHVVLSGGSVAIALIAVVWMTERALEIKLIPA